MIKLIKTSNIEKNESLVLFVKNKQSLKEYLQQEEYECLKTELEKDAEKDFFAFKRCSKSIFVQFTSNSKKDKDENKTIEKCRKGGDSIIQIIKNDKLSNVTIVDVDLNKKELLSYLEGLLLGSYQFVKYKTEDKTEVLSEIKIFSKLIIESELEEIEIISSGNFIARDLVNEPANQLNAVKLSETIKLIGTESGFEVETFYKSKIESLKMGGILAVNKGSVDEPTFNILEWKPEKSINKNAYILVGKGITFDTGGLNLKTGSYMDNMKTDMAGAAAVVGLFYVISKLKLPIHVIGLIPATDNRPGDNALVPGDVITMFNNKTVEVLNTDAEGRLILADALSYAIKYSPELVIDIATLTGSAAAAIGKFGMVGMHNESSEKEFQHLQKASGLVHERIAQFPFWDDYADLIKSDIADLKNIGGREAGAITAGKFLEKFTDYKWIHLDIAGLAFLDAKDSYRCKGATGVGVRLFYEFFKSKIN
ncbi:MAG: hypothetical protein A2X12_10115 [Bacteroidetes bacterium GWE2_29_8]|nr:MAG: hypothetical protein A2X12_10115 [Bacteroidetes bacterium GWE2_29_8]OFY14154.1 MAG: hypothetical protein A2X02_02680 [Bacteroidetes bacterium GWF2_29_10]